MSRLKSIVIGLAALLFATATLAADDTPKKLDRPAGIVVIGSGEKIDALQRAVEEEVAIINADGGVMGQPVKVTRINKECVSTYGLANQTTQEIGKRQPLLVFFETCRCTILSTSGASGIERAIIVGAAVRHPSGSKDQKVRPILRLTPSYHQASQELAFAIATFKPDAVLWSQNQQAQYEADNSRTFEPNFDSFGRQLRLGFQATEAEKGHWGALLPRSKIELINTLGRTEPHLKRLQGSKNTLLFTQGTVQDIKNFIRSAANAGWRGVAIAEIGKVKDQELGPCDGGATWGHLKMRTASFERPSKTFTEGEWLSSLPPGIEVHVFQKQPFYLGRPPDGAKAYTAFHPDWVAGFWQVMKAVKFAKSLDGREIAKTLGGRPFFSRAPWLMLQSQSRYTPPELRQRFNDSGNLRMAGYKLEKIWPKE